MASATVYEGVADGADVRGTLFEGKKFFLTQRLPQRSRFVDLVKSNGGTVVILEKKADYVIADHFRRDCPPGSISYTFIEQSVKDGELADPEQHLAGPATGTLRAAGSTMPAKGTRTPYTPEDDRLLYKWVKDHERGGTGLANGNEIYKQLEKKVWSTRPACTASLTLTVPSAYLAVLAGPLRQASERQPAFRSLCA
jgi:hypothetical protein